MWPSLSVLFAVSKDSLKIALIVPLYWISPEAYSGIGAVGAQPGISEIYNFQGFLGPEYVPAHKEEYHSQDTDQDYDYCDTNENGRCSESWWQDRREIVQTAPTNLPAILAKNRCY